MKKIFFVISVAAILLTTSCNTQRFYVQGMPGTIIKSIDEHETIAVIGQNGEAVIEMNRKDGYTPFLLAQAPGSEKLVPFALNYEDSNRSYTNRGWMVAWLLVPPFSLIGYFGPAWVCLARQGFKYDYEYLNQQHTNNDLIK